MAELTPSLTDPNPLLRALSPLNLMTTTLWGEARGETVEGQVAVANVIINRLVDGRWGEDIRSVLLAPAQFSCLWPNGGELFNVLAFATRLHNLNLLNANELQIRYVAAGMLQSPRQFTDPTQGATHYFAASMKQAPAWAAGATQTAAIGGHLFYRNVR